MVTVPSLIFYFDYVDPGSFLVERQLNRILSDKFALIRHPFELRSVSEPPMNAQSPEWITYCKTVESRAEDIGLRLAHPLSLPWSRKAHELRLHAVEKGMEEPTHQALLKARFEDGADVGRIDVLVSIAGSVGLDTTESKAVLDVDRYADAVAGLRHRAQLEGIKRTPMLCIGPRRLEGPAQINDLRVFLEGKLPI